MYSYLGILCASVNGNTVQGAYECTTHKTTTLLLYLFRSAEQAATLWDAVCNIYLHITASLHMYNYTYNIVIDMLSEYAYTGRLPFCVCVCWETWR